MYLLHFYYTNSTLTVVIVAILQKTEASISRWNNVKSQLTLLNTDSHTKHRYDAPYLFCFHLKRENHCIVSYISIQTACFSLVLQSPTHVLRLVFLGTTHTLLCDCHLWFSKQGPDLSSQSFTFLTFWSTGMKGKRKVSARCAAGLVCLDHTKLRSG